MTKLARPFDADDLAYLVKMAVQQGDATEAGGCDDSAYVVTITTPVAYWVRAGSEKAAEDIALARWAKKEPPEGAGFPLDVVAKEVEQSGHVAREQ